MFVYINKYLCVVSGQLRLNVWSDLVKVDEVLVKFCASLVKSAWSNLETFVQVWSSLVKVIQV